MVDCSCGAQPRRLPWPVSCIELKSNQILINHSLTALRVAPLGQSIIEYLREEEAYSAFVDLYMSYKIEHLKPVEEA